jgi:hypothetical protein
MKPNDPAGQAAAEARAADARQRLRDLPALMAKGARRAGPPAGRLPTDSHPPPQAT